MTTQQTSLSELIKPAAGSTKKRKRVGRGNASGMGGESGRGHKGQKSRTGYSKRSGFEGGQTPLYRRLPKKRGIGNGGSGFEYAIINLGTLETSFAVGEVVSMETLSAKGLVKSLDGLKILGTGELTKALVIKAHAVSKSALEKLKKVNATVEIC